MTADTQDHPLDSAPALTSDAAAEPLTSQAGDSAASDASIGNGAALTINLDGRAIAGVTLADLAAPNPTAASETHVSIPRSNIVRLREIIDALEGDALAGYRYIVEEMRSLTQHP